MRDDFSSRFWAENHHLMTHAFGKAIDKLYYAFKRLNARQYSAPWRDCPE